MIKGQKNISLGKLPAAVTLAAAAFALSAQAADDYKTVEAVSVTAEALKIDTSTQETPQTVNVISGQELADKTVRKLDDALRYTPGFVNTFGTDYDTNWIKMRGFEASLLVNGQRQFTEGYFDTTVEPYLLESVEVLQGPSSSLYGDSMPGGVINLVTKKPTKTPQHSVSLSGGSNKYVQGGFDFSDYATEDGSKRYRIVAMVNREDSVLDDVDGWRAMLAPSFTIDIDERSSLTFMMSYLKDRKTASNGFFPAYGTLFSRNGHHIPASTNYGDPDDAYNKDQVDAGWELKLGLNDVWTYKQNVSFHYNKFYLHSTAAYGYVDAPNQQGVLVIQPMIPRYLLVNDGDQKSFTFDNNLTAHWFSGDFENTFQIGFDNQWHHTNWLSNGSTGTAYGTIDPLNPSHIDLTGAVPLSLYGNSVRKHQFGIYTQAQTNWNETLVAKLGGRYDRISITSSNEDYRSNVASNRDELSDSHFSWNAGLMYLAPFGISPYVNYSEAFFATGTLNAATTDDWSQSTYMIDKPITTKQKEVGIKITPEWIDGFLNIAWFEITQENGSAQVMINGTPAMRQIGEKKNRGLEVQGRVSLAKYLTIDASYTYLDAKQGNKSGAMERTEYLPHHTASGWVSYDFTGVGATGLTIGSGLRYLGDSIDTVYGSKVPAVTLWDASLNWLINKNWTLSGTVTNITDKEFVTGCYNNMCYYGEGRTARATLTYNW